MKTLYKLAFAVALTAAALLSTPSTVSAGPTWCATCDATGDCLACCRCEGGGAGYCNVLCYGW